MDKKTGIVKKQQEVLYGSSVLFEEGSKSDNRTSYMIKNIEKNISFTNLINTKNINDKKTVKEALTNRFIDYRRNWHDQPKNIMQNKTFGKELLEQKIIPLCLDIEVASICDLACGFCYRESIATPDKIINSKLYYKLIDEASALGVPSVKLNWRGEPLLHPKISNFIRYAKKKGILEVIINTNATKLTKKKAAELIDAGLDYMIFSFDGGTKETYEKMRPGRFKKNKFENVYNNIKNFSDIKKEKGAKFPRTKIQMILTEDTFDEQKSFFNMFTGCVDEVTVTPYSERGGNFNDLSPNEKLNYNELLKFYDLPDGTPYLKDADGKIRVSRARRPCEQPFQRLMVTYDGRVAMCCFDWGAMHTIGYVDDMSFEDLDLEKKEILDNIKNNKKGFELMQFVKMPPKFNLPQKKISTLSEIWTGIELEKVHRLHASNKVDDVKICKGCTFKDTYDWQGK